MSVRSSSTTVSARIRMTRRMPRFLRKVNQSCPKNSRSATSAFQRFAGRRFSSRATRRSRVAESLQPPCGRATQTSGRVKPSSTTPRTSRLSGVSPYSQLVRSMVSTSFPLGSSEIRKGSQHTSTCSSWKQRARRLRLASAVLVPGSPLASFFWLVLCFSIRAQMTSETRCSVSMRREGKRSFRRWHSLMGSRQAAWRSVTSQESPSLPSGTAIKRSNSTQTPLGRLLT